MTALDGADAGPVPTEFVAVTVNVYRSPLVAPFWKIVVPVVVPDTGAPPFDEMPVTV